MYPFLSVIIPYSNQNESRIPALRTTLDCLRSQDYVVMTPDHEPTDKKNFEVIFVEQKTSDNYEVLELGEMVDNHIVVSSYTEFNKSWLMNIGAKAAKGNILIYLDADMIFGKEYLYYVNIWRSGQSPNPRFFVGWDWIIKLPGKEEPVARMVRTTALTAGGCFWIDKLFYWECGGMNENYFGYGGEDNDFWIRANCIMGKKNLKNVGNAPYPMAHTYHDCAVPSPARFDILNKTIQFPEIITDRLKKVSLGNMSNPTLIDIKDLQLNQPGIQEGKSARGMN